MNSLRISKIKDSSALYIVLAAVLLVVGTILPTFASAAQITSRSVAIDSSTINAAGVNYKFTFTADNATAGGIAVKFCKNSPLITDTCTAPGDDFDVETAGNVTGGTKYGTWTANTAFITKSVAIGSNEFTITGVHNPSVAGTIYARITTHVTDANAAAGTNVVDNGSVAFAITNGVSVSGAVLESLTFCVSGTTIADATCAGTTAPVLTLGTLDVGTGLTSLNSSSVSTGNVYTMLSTNASSGAVVSLKSTATCGGLAFNGGVTCPIAAAGANGTITAGQAKFGVRLTLPGTNDDSDNNGIIVTDAAYDVADADTYSFDGTAVTSAYGDAIYSTPGYVNGKATTLTFGASAAPNTPAGKYATGINLIATGTF